MADMMKQGATPPPMPNATTTPPPAAPQAEQAQPLELHVNDHPELKNVQPGDDVTLEVHATVDAVSPDGALSLTMNEIVAQPPAQPSTPNEAFSRASTKAMNATPEPNPQGA